MFLFADVVAGGLCSGFFSDFCSDFCSHFCSDFCSAVMLLIAKIANLVTKTTVRKVRPRVNVMRVVVLPVILKSLGLNGSKGRQG